MPDLHDTDLLEGKLALRSTVRRQISHLIAASGTTNLWSLSSLTAHPPIIQHINNWQPQELQERKTPCVQPGASQDFMKVDFDSQTLTKHIHHPLHDPSRIMQGALGRGRPSATPESLPQLLQQMESEQPPS